MSSEEEIVEDMFGLEKGKCDSDHIGLQDDSETDSSSDEEIKNNKKRQFKVVLDDLSELPFVVKNRIAYINHCIDDIVDLSKDNYDKRQKSCGTAIRNLGKESWRIEERLKNECSRLASMRYNLRPVNIRKESYIKGIGKVSYKKDEKIPDEMQVEFVKKSDELSVNFMFKWLNKEPPKNPYEKYEQVCHRLFLINKLLKIIKKQRSGFKYSVFGIKDSEFVERKKVKLNK